MPTFFASQWRHATRHNDTKYINTQPNESRINTDPFPHNKASLLSVTNHVEKNFFYW
jgi:hypothetical protein